MIGGMFTEDPGDELRTERGLKKDEMALLIKHIGEYGPHAAAKNAGFRKDDIIVSIDGKTTRLSESAMLGYLIQNKKPGEKVKATVLRGGQRMELMVPVQ